MMRHRPSDRSFPFTPSVLAVLTALLAFTLVSSGVPAAAQDVKSLARQANNEIRTSQRHMFSRKLEEAKAALDKARDLIDQIKAADPAFSQLKSLESKYAKQEKDLGKKLNKGNSAVDFELGVIDQRIDEAARFLGEIKGGSNEWTLTHVEGSLNNAKSAMDKIMSKYGDKVSADDPKIASRQKKIDDFEAELNAYKSGKKAESDAAAADLGVKQEKARAVGAKLEKAYEAYNDRLQKIHGNTLVYDLNIDNYKKALADVQSIEKEIVPAVQPILAEIAENYGTTSMDVDNALHAIKIPSNEWFGSEFERIYEAVQNLENSRKASAEYIVREANNTLGYIDSFAPDIRVKKMEEVKEMLRIANQFDPNNQDANALLADIDARIAEMSDKIEKDIDAKKWAGNISDFAGPGNAKSLAKEAVKYFKGNPQWTGKAEKKVEILAVAVRGQWDVAETNIFGQVIRWRLPIHLAITDVNLKPKNIARVYELSALTRQGAPDKVEKAPPYDGYWVGNSWMMRLNNLP